MPNYRFADEFLVTEVVEVVEAIEVIEVIEGTAVTSTPSVTSTMRPRFFFIISGTACLAVRRCDTTECRNPSAR